MTAGAAGGAAVAAAAAKKRMDEKEEEEMTSYNSDDMDKWEFKIMRSAMGRFGNYEYLQKVCQTEAEAGWEMVEKFDNNRVRFKRRIDRRSNDRHLKHDPYRTSVSFGGSNAALLTVGVFLALTGLAFLLFFYYR